MSDRTDLPPAAFPDPIPAQGPVLFHAPAAIRPPATYQAVGAFVRARGCVPQTITLHPETLAAAMRMTVLHEAQKAAEAVLAVVHQEEQVLQPMLKGAKQDLSVVTSHAHDRDPIVMA